ncbi:MAG: D-TA family PLP-dependent enzyme, partial [Planctomycetaceae bacterium]|nr:D-TA family PLP-dependent enzyme [Planctomycetaceae bacterium]
PHCKTHKMPNVVQLELSKGIQKHKAATFAEAEMLAEAGVPDVFLAYNLVGPNIDRAVTFRKQYPLVTFSVTADDPRPVAQLGDAMHKAGLEIDVLLDLDTGQHRTGLPVGGEAKNLYQILSDTAGVRAGGLHLYDGQNHQQNLAERQAAVDECWNSAIAFRDELLKAGLTVPRLVAGGTGSFPIYAQKDDPTLELSPGTCVFHDAGYGGVFPDLKFTPAAMLLTRVVSRPTANRITLDLGYKAVASDPPAGRRVVFPDLSDAEQVLQNEEHLVLETSKAGDFAPGDELLAIPRHVCPTSALHKEAILIENGEAVATWPVIARDRQLTV